MNQIVAQALGIVAMFFHIFSYQQKTAKGIITCQLFGSLFFGVNYLLLGAYIGTIMNVVGIVRAILFLKKDTLHTERMWWLIGFGVAYVLAYLLNFTVLQKEPTLPNLLVECLPVVGMFATHLAFRHNSTKVIRRFCLISSVSWLIFNVVTVSIGAIACEAFSLVSIFIAMARLDREEQ